MQPFEIMTHRLRTTDLQQNTEYSCPVLFSFLPVLPQMPQKPTDPDPKGSPRGLSEVVESCFFDVFISGSYLNRG